MRRGYILIVAACPIELCTRIVSDDGIHLSQLWIDEARHFEECKAALEEIERYPIELRKYDELIRYTDTEDSLPEETLEYVTKTSVGYRTRMLPHRIRPPTITINLG